MLLCFGRHDGSSQRRNSHAEDVMNLQSKAHLCAVVSASAALFLFPLSAGAQVQRATESFDGLWLTDGYGELIEVQGDNLRAYEITALSCMPAAKATRRTEASNEIVFAGEDGTLRISPGPFADTRWLHEDGGVANILIRRTGSRPELCDQPPDRHPALELSGLLGNFLGTLSLFRAAPDQLARGGQKVSPASNPRNEA